MPASLLRTLTLLAGLAAGPALAQTPSPAAPAPAAKPEIAPAADAKAAPIDINAATAQELSQLKGIGEARSAAIVKGRPYRGKDDLLHRKIIPEAVYAEIKDRIIAKQK